MIVNDKTVIFVRIYFQMWPDILDKARRGGLNLIQTYVFWNGHEPEKDKVCKKKNLKPDLMKMKVCSD